MNDDVDKELARRVQNAMSDDGARLEQNIARKLQLSRYQALEHLKANDRERSLFYTPKLVSAAIFACSIFVVFAIGLIELPREHSQPPATVEADTTMQQIDAIEISPAELELVEELEFYEWLESNGHAG